MKELITKIYIESDYYRDYCKMNLFFSLKRKEIEKYDPKEFIIAALGSWSDGNLASDLLLYSRWLWKDFHLEDWKHILTNVDRKKVDYTDLHPACYRDISFLCYWFGINAIDLFLTIESVSNEDKEMMIAAGRIIFPHLIYIGPFEEDQFFQREEGDPYDDEVDSIVESDFILQRERLMSEGAKFGFSSHEDLLQYMDSLES